MFLGVGFRRSERRHQRTDGLGQDVQYPLRDSLTEGEIISREEDVAQENGDGSKNDEAQQAEDVLPDR